jgi:hypothetical protein
VLDMEIICDTVESALPEWLSVERLADVADNIPGDESTSANVHKIVHVICDLVHEAFAPSVNDFIFPYFCFKTKPPQHLALSHLDNERPHSVAARPRWRGADTFHKTLAGGLGRSTQRLLFETSSSPA